jgi:hypothetical protein
MSRPFVAYASTSGTGGMCSSRFPAWIANDEDLRDAQLRILPHVPSPLSSDSLGTRSTGEIGRCTMNGGWAWMKRIASVTELMAFHEGRGAAAPEVHRPSRPELSDQAAEPFFSGFMNSPLRAPVRSPRTEVLKLPQAEAYHCGSTQAAVRGSLLQNTDRWSPQRHMGPYVFRSVPKPRLL